MSQNEEKSVKEEKVQLENENKHGIQDPYAYLENSGFTSEKFKIEIRNLPKYYGLGELRKLLNDKLKLGSNKVKPPRRGSFWVYVCFRSEEDRSKALEVLNGYVWKGNKLTADIAKPAPDPLVKKRNEDFEDKDGKKKQKTNLGSQVDQLRNATTPLWQMPYEDQLKSKQNEISNILKKFAFELVKANPQLKDWANQQKEKHDGLICELWPIKHSESGPDGYRNKCEFSIGLNEETGEKTVGFRLGSYATGTLCVAPIDELQNVPQKMKQAVDVLQKYVRKSQYDVFNPETHTGHWRQLTARYGFKTDELMLVIGIHPQTLSESDLNDLKLDLIKYFKEEEGSQCNVTSLYLQLIEKRKSQEDAPKLIHLSGETYIREELLGFMFRISPEAFFQINTSAAEILYSSIADLADLKPNVSLLDVCCGTGSIGICLSKKCHEVLGLEISQQAIDDAKENALANNVCNTQFYVGKAEDILSSVAFRASAQETVAIVDPPRAGLHHSAIIQLRKTKQLNKLVYVSCEPKLALRNFVDLARPSSKVYHRSPFVPVKAVPVDMFPMTKHCELVIYFERMTDEEDSNVSAKTELNSNTTAIT